MKKIFVIAGATASGKTAVAVELAKRVDGEVISADSMQVYRGLDIGTAKPDDGEMAGVPHHMLSVVAPDEAFSVAEFQRGAMAAMEGIFARGKVPILAGGTGFYINAVLYGAEFSDEYGEEEKLREEYALFARDNGAEALHEKLAAADPAYAATIHANNVKRVARALAYCVATGGLFFRYNAVQKEKKPLFDAAFYVLSLPRDILYARINARVFAMLNAGLIEEVQNLLTKGYDKSLAAMQGIGYKETIQFLSGEATRDEAIAAIQQNTRRYAKRQETWFRNQTPNAHVLHAEGKTARDLAVEILKE
ncbi:MAG: tRNA (adenosine(37)-N6)-dimethylallyltransferase MiaA [Defluviitaleaceae bacterium]|nr:tRNA (adenosine(37)-N6)-dimethylallyltransferase MiaA [Defluviitaleaceae bacterium]